MRIHSSNPDERQNEQAAPPRRSLGKRIAAWVGGGVVALLLVIALAAFFVLHSARFHNFALNTIEKKASSKLQTRVTLENFAVHFAPLRADLYGLTIDGASPYPNPPLLQVQHIAVSAHIVSVLHREWYLQSVQVDAPVVKFFTGTNGTTNLPHLKKSNSSSSVNVFQLGVRHVLLRRGAIYVNDRKAPLEADLHQLEFHSRYVVGKQQYSGEMSYKDGQLQAGSFAPVPHDFNASFVAAPEKFKLTSATLRSGASQFHVAAQLTNFAAPVVTAKYDISVNAGDLRATMRNPSIPAGTIVASGELHSYSVTGIPLLKLITLNGTVSSRLLDIHTPEMHADIRNFGASYSLANGNLSVSKFQADVLGGKVLAGLRIDDLTGKTHSKLTGTWRGLSLADAQGLLPASSTNKTLELTGSTSGNVQAAWGKTFKTAMAQMQATLSGRITNRDTANFLPLKSAVSGTYVARGQQIRINRSYIKLPQTSLTVNGAVSNRSHLAIRFYSGDLRELQMIADVVRPATSNAVAPLGLAGQAMFQGTVYGSTTQPHIAGNLDASNVHLRGTVLPKIHAGIAVSPQSASLQNGTLQILPHGSIDLSGGVTLRHWAFNKRAPIQLQLRASHLAIQQLSTLAGMHSTVTGQLAANANVRGTGENPLGNGTLSITSATAYGEHLQSVALVFGGTPDSVHGTLSVKMTAGVIHGNATIQPKEQTYTAQISADNFDLQKFQALKARSINATGSVSLDANGHGTFKNPQVTARLQLPRLDVQGQVVSDIKLGLDLANHKASATLSSRAANTSLQAHANLNLFGNYMVSAALDTQAIPLQPLVALYAPSMNSQFSGQTAVHATVQGPLKQKNLLVAHLVVPMFHVAYGKDLQLALASPLRADYVNGLLQVQRTRLQGTDTDLQMQASVPFYGTQPMAALLSGTIDLRLAQLFSSDIQSSGKVLIDLTSSGSRTNPNFGGQVTIQDANYANGTLPIGLQHGNGVLTLTKNRLNIRSFQGNVGGGTVTAQGGVNYRPALQFDLGAAAHNVRMLYPQGLREELSANLRLAGTERDSQLGGSVQIGSLSFTPAFDLMKFIGNLSGGIAAPPTPGFSQNLHLDLAVNSANGIDLVSRTLSVNGTANLQVRGTAAQPVILGRVNLNDGDVIFNGNRFVLTGGTIQFVNPTQTEPVVNLALNTTVQQYNIHLRFNGPMDQIQTNYASDPSLPSADIINLLAFGQTTEANSANAPTPGNVAAESVLAGQVSSQITNRVSKIAGISQLSIDPVLAGGSTQGPAGAIVTVQQRVTSNFFVTYSTNVTTTQDQIIMGQYQLSPRVSVTGTRDQNGGFAMDTIFKKSW